jgi:hypothetical protein
MIWKHFKKYYVTLSDELEVGYYVTLFLIMYADDTALLAVCK